MSYIIGIDEVGRGPIAGPLVVCACAVASGVDILHFFPHGILKDSKKLSEKNRQDIATQVELYTSDRRIVYGLGEISAQEIDALGLSRAIKEATQKALDVLHAQGIAKETKLFLDGSLYADKEYEHQETVIKGDEKIGQIALASIIAKVYRDNLMQKVAHIYPDYEFENHVGYGTQAHYVALKQHGLTEQHRKSFLKRIL